MARSGGIEERVARAGEEILAVHHDVSVVDVLNHLGWLPAAHIDRWRQGRVDCLEATMQLRPAKIATALQVLRRWADERGLVAAEMDYVARTRDRRSLRFSVSGAADVERAYRTHWVSPELSEAQRAQLVERQSEPPELVVISPLKEWTCATCGGSGDLLFMREEGPVCMACAALDHLVFLPRGDAGLTRRAHKASELSAVVVRFSRTRKRYERQGLLVEPDALAAAEQRN
ncbi:MAG: hypothetical protein GEV09_20890 [Pseudonocardiaceae bacterium]|nr:hypothetical protein [Pseudonocardiaceae bacterium]